MSRLQDDLDELARTDPAVAKAKRRLDELPETMARYNRHMAARKVVGRRCWCAQEGCRAGCACACHELLIEPR